MSQSARPPGRRPARLAWRLFLLFVLVALLPLALTDWLASIATSEVATRLSVEHRRATTRHTSRQVLDRMLSGKALLAAQGENTNTQLPTNLNQIFNHIVHLGNKHTTN